MSSNNNEIQNLFTILLDSVLTKVSRDHKIKLDELKNSIGTITFTEDLSDSINSFCSILNPIETPKPKRILKKSIGPPAESEVVAESPKPKKVLKKTVPVTETPAESEVVADTPAEAEVVADAPKPKKVLKKTVPVTETPTETEVVAQSPKEAEPVAQAPKPKKVLKKTVPVTETPTEAEVVTQAPKPKKVLKKAEPIIEAPTAAEVVAQAPEESEKVVETPKPKKILKKTIQDVETPVEEIDTQTIDEPEVKIKPKKIIVKRAPIENVAAPEPKQKSKKEVDIVEYGSDEQHDENAAVYDSIQMYEDDLLEPREINGVKYLVDSSEYIYDMESQELLGKLSEKDKNNILFLKNFAE